MALNNKKLFKRIIALTKRIDTDWGDDLYELGIHTIFKLVYDSYEDNLRCNTIVAFVVLAYCKESDWIVMTQERMRNKSNILKNLGMPQEELEKDFWTNIIAKNDIIVNEVAESFLEHQKDSRWESVIIKKEYYSENIKFVNQPISETKEIAFRGEVIQIRLSDEELLKAKIAKGKLLTEAHDQEQSARKIYNSIEEDFLKINKILNDEEASSITSDIGSTWESQITKRNRKNRD